MTSLACLVGSGLKPIFHRKTHLFISFRSLFRLLVVLSGTLTLKNRDVLSANNLGLHWRCRLHYRTLRNTSINIGQLWPLRITLFLFLKKSVKGFNKFPEIPFRLSLCIIPSSHTLSKASRNVPLIS